MFPHADDEAVTCAGTLHCFAARGAAVTLLHLTGGERGNPAGVVDDALKAIRRDEAREVARILGISRLIQADFADGALQENCDQVRLYLTNTIEFLKPDLVITYDLAGLDGHPDHIACAELLTDLRHNRFVDLRLWYVALPAPLQWLLTLVGQMKPTEWIATPRARPTHGLYIGAATLAKMRAVRAYRSQRRAIGKGLGRFVPPWLMVGLQPVEYFAEVT